ncbi:biotin/lipoyl-containing protein [Rhodococcus sp. 27YEA15]|uniref:biotin/lipoyl-containing protein n=1 Tax=Rhodococcus sp. 27YEA15 TaxID=3156259 RepID=UPI003C7C80E0
MAEEAEFRLPDLGEGLHDAELVSWSVAVGDVVRLNQILVEVETAKAVVELPSPLAGTVIALLFEPGDTVPVGSPIIRISTDMHSDHDPKAAVLVGYGTDATPQTRRRKRRPPSVGDIATEGTPTSTVGEQDSHIGRLQLRTTPRRDAVTPSGGDAEHNGSAPTGPSRESRLRASGHRRRTAEAMTNSWRSTPHATVFVTVDLTESMAAIDYLQETARFSDLKLTPLTLTAKAALTALDEFPGLNSSVLR